MRQDAFRLALTGVLVACLVTACAPGANPLAARAPEGVEPAGFLLGVWHGFIMMFTFIVSLFSDSVGIYEVHNTGWSYDLGFLFGAMMFLSGGGSAAKGSRK